MAKYVTASNLEIIVKDETGALVNIDFTCPHCGWATGVFISVGAGSVGCLDGGWETDQVCPVCNKDVIVQCP